MLGVITGIAASGLLLLVFSFVYFPTTDPVRNQPTREPIEKLFFGGER